MSQVFADEYPSASVARPACAAGAISAAQQMTALSVKKIRLVTGRIDIVCLRWAGRLLNESAAKLSAS